MAWKVIMQQQQTGQLPNGSYGPGYTVQFQVDGGGIGEVFVPLAQYNEDTVKAMISPRAATMMNVANLFGE